MMPLLAAIVERVRTWLGWPKRIDQPNPARWRRRWRRLSRSGMHRGQRGLIMATNTANKRRRLMGRAAAGAVQPGS